MEIDNPTSRASLPLGSSNTKQCTNIRYTTMNFLKTAIFMTEFHSTLIDEKKYTHFTVAFR